MVNLQHAFRRLGLAVEGLRGDGDLDRLLLGLPVVGRQGRFQGGVADVDTLVAGAGLAGRVGHVGRDREVEGRLVLLRHGEIGLGHELDGEAAVRLRDGGAMGDVLAGRCWACATRRTSTTI